jgi:hypothetical protein
MDMGRTVSRPRFAIKSSLLLALFVRSERFLLTSIEAICHPPVRIDLVRLRMFPRFAP